MNRIIKVILATIGACSIVFDIVTPILLSLIVINISGFNPMWTNYVWIAAILATLYRGLKPIL